MIVITLDGFYCNSSINFTRWMSEKMDGIRAYWNGKTLYSKYGNQISVPSSFTRGLPCIQLDGELWMGRGSFSTLQKILKSKDSDDWEGVKYMVFDLPGSEETYGSRISELKELRLPSHVHIVEVNVCEDKQHLARTLDVITKDGGEGLMIHDPNSPYIAGRTSVALKVKVLVFGEKLII